MKLFVPRALAFRGVTGRGFIVIRRRCSRIEAHTGAGGVELQTGDAALLSLNAAVGNGDIRIEAATVDERATLTSGRGDVRLVLCQQCAGGPVALSTGAGHVTLGLPDDTPGSLTLTAPNGGIVVEGSADGTMIRSRWMFLELGGEGPHYTLSMPTGDIHVLIN